MVFLGDGSGGQLGIYTDAGGVLDKIIDLSDPLNARTLTGLSLGRESFDGNQIAFAASFDDGNEGIFLATIPEPTTAALLGLGITILAAARNKWLRSS